MSSGATTSPRRKWGSYRPRYRWSGSQSGRESLLAVLLSTCALNWLNYTLSSEGYQYALIIIGALLVAVMVFFPSGIVVTLARDLPSRLRTLTGRRKGEAG